MMDLYRLKESPLEPTKIADLEKRAKQLKDKVEKGFDDLIHDSSIKLDKQQQYDRLVCWLHR
jgi:hypothetical protein